MGFGTIILPGQPGIIRQAVRRQGIEIAQVIRTNLLELREQATRQFVILIFAPHVIAKRQAGGHVGAEGVRINFVLDLESDR